MTTCIYAEGIDMEASVPKYQRIANKLRERIAAGEFKAANGKLPSEHELAEQEGVALETIRDAKSVLIAEGLIVVRHGAGTYVRDFKPIFRDANRRLSAKQWAEGHAIWSADIGLRGLDIIELTVGPDDAPEWVARRLGATQVIVRDRVFVVEGRRVQIATSYLPVEIVAGSPIEQEDTGAGGTYARLKDLGFEVTHFDEDVRSRLPSAAETKRLKLRKGAWVVEIIRNALTADDRIVEVNWMVLDADSYVLHWSFTA